MSLSRIAISLSGGGIRALSFHMGVLARLAAENLMENIVFISSVSGGSLGVGLVLALNNWTWPTSADFLSKLLPNIERILTTKDMGLRLALATATSRKHLIHRNANELARLLEQEWGIAGSLRDLSDTPRWVINATCHETGKRWRFEKKRIADYTLGEIKHPDFPISRAIAASAAVPYLVGPLRFEANQFEWSSFNSNKVSLPSNILHLWDGAVYDNLGVETFVKQGGEYRSEDFDFLIISDGSPSIEQHRFNGVGRWPRLIEIIGNQAQSLRSRDILGRLESKEMKGAYFKLGRTVDYIVQNGGKDRILSDNSCLSRDEVSTISKMKLSLKKLKADEWKRLVKHGFETADYVLHTHNQEIFPKLYTLDTGLNPRNP